MTTSDYKSCIDCGASFKKSRADYTVRCPDCRRARRYGFDTSRKNDCIVCNGEGRYEVGPMASTAGMVIVKCHNCDGTGVSPYKRLV
jgi:DnaJ-class molecular chaperone